MAQRKRRPMSLAEQAADREFMRQLTGQEPDDAEVPEHVQPLIDKLARGETLSDHEIEVFTQRSLIDMAARSQKPVLKLGALKMLQEQRVRKIAAKTAPKRKPGDPEPEEEPPSFTA